MIADKPSHGYELIKAVEDRLQGRYSPSAGVLYPTLTWLEELDFIAPSASEAAGELPGRASRKRFQITPQGQAYLADNRAALDALHARMAAVVSEPHERPPQIERAVANFKMAVHMRLARGPLDAQQIRAFARVLDAAAQDIESL